MNGYENFSQDSSVQSWTDDDSDNSILSELDFRCTEYVPPVEKISKHPTGSNITTNNILTIDQMLSNINYFRSQLGLPLLVD
jgi:hypothetical protein